MTSLVKKGSKEEYQQQTESLLRGIPSMVMLSKSSEIFLVEITHLQVAESNTFLLYNCNIIIISD